MADYEIETHRRVYENKHGEYIKVGPDTDGLGLVEIDGGEFFGGRIVIDPDLAMLLAKAIELTAKELLP